MHWIAPSEKDAADGALRYDAFGRIYAGGNSPKDCSGDPTRELSIHGVEKTDETGRLCRTNLH